MKKILLRGKHGARYTMMDDEDYRLFGHLKWIAVKQDTLFYARTHNVKAGQVYLQNLIMWKPKGLFIDHINGNGLDNRRVNLRVANNHEQARNRRKQKNNTSGYVGVSPYRGKWRVQITVNRKRNQLGLFTSKIKAARVYDEAAMKHFGAFAKLNFPKRAPAKLSTLQ